MNTFTQNFSIRLLQILVLGGILFASVLPAKAVTISELESMIATLTEQLKVLTQQKNAVQDITSPCTFDRVLTIGTQGEDVRCLQKHLAPAYFKNIDDATGYFGPLTLKAVAEWQKTNGIVPMNGYFGPLSQARYSVINNLTSGMADAEQRLQGLYRIKNGVVVYKDAKVVIGADPTTFEVLDGSGYDELHDYAKDKNHVYRDEMIIPNLDPKTVKVNALGSIEYLYDKSAAWWISKDASTWYEAEKMDVDVPSFSFLLYYAKDKNIVYSLTTGKEVSADVTHFTELNGRYAKDQEDVFYQGKVIHEADPDTFVVVGAPDEGSIPFAKDKNHVYLGVEVVKNGSAKLCTKEHLDKCGSKN